jgi:radical SAM superfamily enzyme YgiQ (UPF0313 family)
MRASTTTIHLAELAHDGFGLSLNTIPLGIGVVGAFCKKIHSDNVDISLFRLHSDLATALREKPPDIVAFGYYSWNDEITRAAAAFVRRACPNALIVVGGANISFEGWSLQEDNEVPVVIDNRIPIIEANRLPIIEEKMTLCAAVAVDDDRALLASNPAIDLIIHGDAEVAFSNVVSSYRESGDRMALRRSPADGCSALFEGELRTGSPVPLLFDLDEVPSPYQTGMYDEFFERFDLLPQIETMRGCPYECTFCTIGGHSNRLRKYSVERIKEDILYIKDNSPSSVLRMADPNWGILPRDVEVAQFIRNLHDETGFPTSLRVYYAANGPFKNVKKMADLLKPLLPLNMSFQSMNDETLNDINRRNMRIEKVEEMISFAHANGMAASTELISSLPSESYEDFRNGFIKALELRLDSIMVQPLYLIKGSELYPQAAREMHGLKTMFSLTGTDVTNVAGEWLFEADEIVVETNALPVEDFWKTQEFALFTALTYNAAYLKELLFHAMNYGVSVLDIQDELFTNPESYPFIDNVKTDFMEVWKSIFFKTREDLHNALVDEIASLGNVDRFNRYRQTELVLGVVLSGMNKTIFVEECTAAIRALHIRKNGDQDHIFLETLAEISRFTLDIIISIGEELEEYVVRESYYDLVEWSNDGYVRPLAQYQSDEPIKIQLYVRNFPEHQQFIETTHGWNDIERYHYYFNVMVSSNMRRFFDYAHNSMPEQLGQDPDYQVA